MLSRWAECPCYFSTFSFAVESSVWGAVLLSCSSRISFFKSSCCSLSSRDPSSLSLSIYNVWTFLWKSRAFYHMPIKSPSAVLVNAVQPTSSCSLFAAFLSVTTSFFFAAFSCSSRSIAWRTGRETFKFNSVHWTGRQNNQIVWAWR